MTPAGGPARAPLVLVTSIARAIPTTLPGLMDNATINQRFGRLIAAAGGIAIASDAWTDPPRLAERVDAVVINGGIDVDPGRYGAVAAETTDAPQPQRDEFELGLAAAAIERGIPILGVCRGMHILNVALGGTLIQHLPDRTSLDHYVKDPYDAPVHGVEFAEDSILARAVNGRELQVNSVHHQAVDELGAGLRVTGTAPDGIPESIENGSGSVIGIQWHPEFMTEAHDERQLGIFKALVPGG